MGIDELPKNDGGAAVAGFLGGLLLLFIVL
jgi:hypothetical protein